MTEKEKKLMADYNELPGDSQENKKCTCGDDCTCGDEGKSDGCTCGDDCECGDGCTCGDDCECGDDCTCGDDCESESEDKYEPINKEAKLKLVEILCNEDESYHERLDAYETLSEEGEEIADEMLKKLYTTEGDTQQMLIEILANFKGRRDIYMWLVTSLYRGEDVALFARLLGSYGEEAAIDVLKSFADENELNYNEFMEVRNAVETLGGDIEEKTDFSSDPFYKYLKGQDSPLADEQSDDQNLEFDARDGEESGDECGEDEE